MVGVGRKKGILPKVSVLVPVYNAEPFLRATLSL